MPHPQMRREAKLLDTAQLYDILVSELIDVAIFLIDPDGLIVSWNPGVERLLGYQESEWIGFPTEIVFTPEDRERGAAKQDMVKAALDGRSPNARWHIQKNGQRLFVESSLVALRDKAGQLRGFLKVMRDITECKRKEDVTAFLLHLDEQLRPLTDPLVMMHTATRLLGEHLGADRCSYCQFDADQECLEILRNYVRPGVQSIEGRYRLSQFGTAAAELLRSGAACIVEDIRLDPSSDEIRETYEQTKIRAHVAVPLRKGEKLAAALGVHQETPRQWRSDEVDLIGSVASRCWETIERARTAANLRENQARLRTALDIAQLGTFEWDVRTSELMLDDRSRAIFGISPGHETSVQSIFERIDPSIAPRILAESLAAV